MSFPDASTRFAAVVGHPIAHSLSPQIHNAALRHEGRNAVYLAFDVPPGALTSAVEALRSLGAVGCNVTIPHKGDAARIADDPSEDVRRTGAANTLVLRPDGVAAHNTDVPGVLAALRGLRVDPQGLDVLVLGSGGAGRAAAWALAGAGARSVAVANRTRERAEELVRALEGAGHGAELVAWEDRDTAVGRCGILVNATSVGLEGPESPLSPEALVGAAVGGCRAVLDLVYTPRETTLVGAAREAGLRAADGLEVLVCQGAEAYRLLWGTEPSVEVMHEAAATAAGRRRSPRPEEGSVPPIV